MKLLRYIAVLVMISGLLFSSEIEPTKEEVAKLYVATFNRAPDSAGLEYWVNNSGLTLSQIAQSFFDQRETQELYPPTVTNREFIESVYQNLFNREPDSAGWDYWEEQLNIGAFSKNRFIEAVINGALGDDAVILSNKTEVGLYFADAGLSDTLLAKDIMSGVSSSIDSITLAKERINEVASVSSSWQVTDILNHSNIVKEIEINGERCTISQDSSGIHYVCEGDLESSGDFSYGSIASALSRELPEATSNSSNIVVAESDVSNENFTFFAPPIIYKGLMYGAWGGHHMVDSAGYGGTTDLSDHILLKINEYNLTKFDHDMKLEELISRTIYESDTEYLSMFQSEPTNLMELDGFLYFTKPAERDYSSLDDLSQGIYYEILKYSLLRDELVYDRVDLPHFDYNSAICPTAEGMTNYIKIAYGWMVPSSGNKIAFLDGERQTQIDMCSGEDVKVQEDSPSDTLRNCNYSTLVKQVENEYRNPYTISVSDSDFYYAINVDTLSKTYFNRQGRTAQGVSYVDRRVNVFDDFKALSTSSGAYIYLELLGSPIIDMQKARIYLLGLLTKDTQDYKSTADLYLFEYDTDLNLLSANKLVQGENLWDVFKDDGVYAFSVMDPHFYKYQNRLFFVYADKDISMPKLYSYNIDTKSIDYAYELYEERAEYQEALSSATTDEQRELLASVIPRYTTHYLPVSNDPLKGYDYAITGDSIIMPQNIAYGDNDSSYEIVFNVIDIATGEKKRSISHNLVIDDWSDYNIAIQASYVYANSVYFVMKKQYSGTGDHYSRNVLIKIDSPSNRTQVTRYRGDNRLSGVIRNFQIESHTLANSDEESLIAELYDFLNNPQNQGDDLKIVLLNSITEEKGLVSTSELFGLQDGNQDYTLFSPTYTDIGLSSDINYSQERPLYNTELVTDTQDFYIPLLRKVTYSSSNDGSDFGEARIKINAQYGCSKSYFNFPANGSVKILGFNPVDEDYEFDDEENMPESLSFYPDVPMLMVDYSSMLDNQIILRYGVDAIEHDSLDTMERITRSIKSNLDSLISTGISIVSGNYVSAVCSTANIITQMTIDNLQEGDTYYGSAMKIYTANSNFGIDNNRSFKADKIEGSATSYRIDADSAGDIVEGVCSAASIDPVAVYAFVTKADVSKKHIYAEVIPTWHKGISISHLKVEIIDTQFFNQPTVALSATHLGHNFDVDGYVGVLGTQKRPGESYYDDSLEYKPFIYTDEIDSPIVTQGEPFTGWSYSNKVLLDSDYSISDLGSVRSSTAGVYIEIVFYSDDIQMGVFSDTLFLDEAIYTDNFTKNSNSYSITLTKPFYLPDRSLDFERVVSGNVTYRVTFDVE